MSDIEWDPTGRYVVSYVSYWNWKAENAYILWNFQGKQLQKQNYDKLYKFSWRPRPPTMITEEHKKVCFWHDEINSLIKNCFIRKFVRTSSTTKISLDVKMHTINQEYQLNCLKREEA